MTALVVRIVDLAGRRPWTVLVLALAVLVTSGAYASGIEVRSDLAELLPHDSPALRAYEHQAARAGGSSMLIVIVSSPDPKKNEHYVDALAKELATLPVAYIESGTRDVRAFYEANKWLYADLGELERVDADLDHQIAIRSGLVEDLDAPEAEVGAVAAAAPALGLADPLAAFQARAEKIDAFPSGYFSARGGTLLGVRIATSAALGGREGDDLLAAVQRITSRLGADPAYAGVEVGFTGEVASAAGEKKALVGEAAYATAVAVGLVVLAIAAYFRSVRALVVVAVPALVGVTTAYAFARLCFGYVSAAGAFLGAIIVGNGINYPIVLFSRYRELRALGREPAVARREAVVSALRAELVGASVASIAYGSLAVTEFRGFRQFGLIGLVGMILVWASIVPIVPALVVILEPAEPAGRRGRPGPVARLAARATSAWPRGFVAGAAGLALLASAQVPRWIVDPWEYDFGKLGSRSSDVSGAGEWSNKANEVFGGKMNIAGALMIADTPEQVPLLVRQIEENDARDPKGKMIAEIATIDDLLPGTLAKQEAKLEVLSRIRSRLTPRVLHDLDGAERATVADARPPETLRPIGPADLPALLRRRFTERSGRLGTVFYVKPKNDVVFADGHNHIRLSRTTDNVRLPDGTVVMTASRSTIFAALLDSLRRDGPLASAVSFGAVVLVVLGLSRDRRVAVAVLGALALGVVWLLGSAAAMGARLNYVSFIALPITFGIGCEYPFNLADRVRLLGGDVEQAVARSSGAVMLCSLTTIIGYGSLLLSDFQALASFGKLAVLGEVACNTAAVLVMPSALALLGRR